MAHQLWLEPALRGSLAVAATSGHAAQAVEPILGWSGVTDWNHTAVWVTRLAGWTVTVVAVSLGAPFWFDMLNKIVNVRLAEKPAEESTRKA
jgi:hypothetical protein